MQKMILPQRVRAAFVRGWMFAIGLFALAGTAPLHAQLIYDSTFHYDGINWRWKYLNGLTYSYGDTWAILPSGRIITAYTEPQQYAGTLHSWRADGHVDTNWAWTWHAVADVVPSGIRTDLVTLPGDTMLILGTDVDISNSYLNKAAVSRLRPDGSVDWSFFGTQRLMAHTGGMNYGTVGRRVAAQPDGKVLVGVEMGSFFPSSGVFRLKANGQRDSTFGVDGFTELFFGSCGYRIIGIHALPNGKMMVGGIYYGTGSKPYFSAIRLKADGHPDSTYGVNGCAHDPMYWLGAEPKGSLLMGDKMVVYGADYYRATAVRFDTSGSLDASFGDAGNGRYWWEMGANTASGIESACMDSMGRLYFYGTRSWQNGQNNFISRVKSNGTPDSSFNQWGHAYIGSPVAGTNYPHGIRTVGKKRIAIFGYVRDANWYYKTYVARFATGPHVEVQGGERLVCAGDTATLYCHTTRPRQWYRANTLLPDTAKALRVWTSGTYYTVTSFNGYADTSEPVVLTFHPRPTAQITQVGGVMQASGGGPGTQYFWIDSSGTPFDGNPSATCSPLASGWYRMWAVSPAGCADTTALFYFSMPNGIAPAAGARGAAEVYPNPARANIYWRGLAEGTVRLYDTKGRAVRAVSASAGIMQVADLAPGLYYLRSGDVSVPVTVVR